MTSKKIKNILTTTFRLFLYGVIGIVMAGNLALAQTTQENPLLPKITPINEFNGKDSKANYIKGVAIESEWQVIIASVIRIILSISSILAFIAFTVGGVMMLASQGDDGMISKGKNILYLSTVALAVMALAFAIVTGITNLKIF